MSSNQSVGTIPPKQSPIYQGCGVTSLASLVALVRASGTGLLSLSEYLASDSHLPFAHTPFRFKALVFTLIRAFEFNLAVSREDIAKKATIVMRPIVKSEADKGNQMPMLMKAYRR